MHVRDLDLNLLAVFQAVGRHQSVTHAAKELNITQPAASAALARLRAALGDPLFVRSSTGMCPTKRGQVLLDAVNTGLDVISRAIRQRGEFDPMRSTAEFTIVMSEIGEIVVMPKLLAYAARTAPGIRFRVGRLTRDYGGELEEGRADMVFGFIRNPKQELRFRKLYTGQFVCLARSGHPLIGSDGISLEAYLQATHLVAGDGRNDEITRALEKIGAARRIGLSVLHHLAIPSIVAQTDLVATVAQGVAEAFAGERVAQHPLPFAAPGIPVALYWHERAQADPANRWLRRAFIDVFRKSPAKPASISPGEA